MTLQEFRDILRTADPKASHYSSDETPNYTVWREFGERAMYAEGRMDEDKIWQIQVDRYTKIPYDPMVDAIRAALEGAEISYEYLCDYEEDTGYIHHIFDCEVD